MLGIKESSVAIRTQLRDSRTIGMHRMNPSLDIICRKKVNAIVGDTDAIDNWVAFRGSSVNSGFRSAPVERRRENLSVGEWSRVGINPEKSVSYGSKVIRGRQPCVKLGNRPTVGPNCTNCAGCAGSQREVDLVASDVGSYRIIQAIRQRDYVCLACKYQHRNQQNISHFGLLLSFWLQAEFQKPSRRNGVGTRGATSP